MLRRPLAWSGSSVGMADPSVSAVVPVRDGERFLGHALESVLGQTLLPDEVIVVDDGSTDGTEAIARRFPARVVPNAGRGVSAARNTGIVASRGDVIAFLDHDDVWEPGKLERQVACLREHPELSYASCRARVVIEPGAERPRWVREEYITGRGFRMAIASAVAVRRETFEEVGLFATDMTLGEDLDWALRVRDAGMKTVILEAALVRYRIHDENTTVMNPENAAMYLRVLRSSLARRRTGAGGSAHAG